MGLTIAKLLVMMEKLRFVNDLDSDLEDLVASIANVAKQSDQLVDCHIKSEDIFLDCYLRFMGAGEVDPLSWRTPSFENSKDN
jgi:hypothetical protein